MCKIMENMRNTTALRNAKEIAICMIKAGKLSLQDIAAYTTIKYGSSLCF